jgi:hypothetical protein
MGDRAGADDPTLTRYAEAARRAGEGASVCSDGSPFGADHYESVDDVPAAAVSLVAASEQAGCWTIQTSIFPENTASLTEPTYQVGA